MAKRKGNNEGSLIWLESEQTWLGQISLPNGKRKRKRNKDRKVVSDWLLEQRMAIKENRIVINENMPLQDFLDLYLATVEHTLADKTFSSYKGLLTVHVIPELGKVKLNQLTPGHLRFLYNKKLEQGLSAKTVHLIHGVIRAALNEAVKWEMLAKNPCKNVTPPKPEKQIPHTLTEEQAKRFLLAVKDHRWYPVYCLAFVGMRRGEILGLKWEDISFDRATVSVRRSLVTIDGGMKFSKPKTGKSRRTIALPPFVVDSLKSHQVVTGKTEGLVFTTKSGRPVNPRNVLRHFQQVLAEIDIPRMRFHDLRHTFATLQLQMGTNPLIVQEILGHADISTTLGTYSHVTAGLQRAAIGKLEDMFG